MDTKSLMEASKTSDQYFPLFRHWEKLAIGEFTEELVTLTKFIFQEVTERIKDVKESEIVVSAKFMKLHTLRRFIEDQLMDKVKYRHVAKILKSKVTPLKVELKKSIDQIIQENERLVDQLPKFDD